MKRTTAMILCLLMTLSFCACGNAPTQEPTPTAAAEATTEPAAEPTAEPVPEVDMQAESAALYAVLDEIDSDSRPGSAGCSLTAVRIAADMLNWAKDTALSDQQISELCTQWMTEKEYTGQTEFNMKMDLVYETYLTLIAEGSGDLMESAGVDYPEGNWGFEPVPAVEAMESTIGPSDMIR